MSASLVRVVIVSEFRRTGHAPGAGPERRSPVRMQVDACRFAFDPVGTGVEGYHGHDKTGTAILGRMVSSEQ
jgi:hypothetical protein